MVSQYVDVFGYPKCVWGGRPVPAPLPSAQFPTAQQGIALLSLPGHPVDTVLCMGKTHCEIL